jgi:hypothetical protein
VEAPAAPEGRGESEAQAIRGREGGADGAHRRGRLAAVPRTIPVLQWLSGDGRYAKGEHGGCRMALWRRRIGHGEGKLGLSDGRCFLKEVARLSSDGGVQWRCHMVGVREGPIATWAAAAGWQEPRSGGHGRAMTPVAAQAHACSDRGGERRR